MYVYKPENVKEVNLEQCLIVLRNTLHTSRARNEICRRKRLWRRLTEPETLLIYEEVIKTAVECCKAHVSENTTFDLTGWAPRHQYDLANTSTATDGKKKRGKKRSLSSFN